MENELGFKELYDVAIKTTSNIEINGKHLEAGETIAVFDKIQLANFKEIRKIATANGGFDNRAHVWWETVQDVSLSFKQGVFSKEHLTIMTNAKLYKYEQDSPIVLNIREPELRVEEENNHHVITLKQEPLEPFFLYKDNGDKVRDFQTISGQPKKLIVDNISVGTTLHADYYYNYNSPWQRLTIGEELTHGYFSLEAKTKVKDDTEDSHVRTGLIKIPKMKLVSDLSMSLGRNATPIVGSLNAVACPTGPRGHVIVMEMIFLNDDIDSDM